jgi:hypothetical protein
MTAVNVDKGRVEEVVVRENEQGEKVVEHMVELRNFPNDGSANQVREALEERPLGAKPKIFITNPSMNTKIEYQKRGSVEKKPAPGAAPPLSKEAQKEKMAEEARYEYQKTKLRKVWGGGLYTKPERLQTQTSEENIYQRQYSPYYWERDPAKETSDFMTLVRKTICIVLANQGFVMREIFVEDGKKIALILNFPEQNMKRYAQELKLYKTVEFGVADIMSLEPIDNKNRPLRTNEYLLDEGLWDRTYVRPMYKVLSKAELLSRIDLRKRIVDLLSYDCSFKRVVRMCSGTWFDGEGSAVNEIYDHQKLDFSNWVAYSNYLIELSVRLNELEKVVKKIRRIFDEHYGNHRIASHANISRRRFDAMELEKYTNREVVRAMKESLKAQPSLRTIWAALNINPTEYSYSYLPSDNTMRPRNRIFHEMVWVDYMIHYPRAEAPVKEEEVLRPPSNYSAPENPLPTTPRFNASQTEKPFDPNIEKEPIEQEKEAQDAEPNSTTKPKQPSKKLNQSSNKKVIESENFISDVIYHHKFTRLEALKIVDYLVNKLINLNLLEKLNTQMSKRLEGTIDKISKFNFLKSEDHSIFFPLHDRRQTLNYNYRGMFGHIRNYKSFYDLLHARPSKAQVQRVTDDADFFELRDEYTRALDEGKSRFITRPNGTSYTTKKSNDPRRGEIAASEASRKNRLISNLSDVSSIRMAQNSNILGALSDAGSIKNPSTLAPHTRQLPKENHSLFSEGLVIDENFIQALGNRLASEHTLKKLKFSLKLIEKGTMFDNEDLEYARKIYLDLPIEGNIPDYIASNKDDLRKIFNRVYEEYYVSDDRLISTVTGALQTSQPLRNFLPTVFKNGNIERFKTPDEITVNYPMNLSFRLTWWNHLRGYPESTIRHYFGEKIALYFGFLAFYRDKLVYPSLIGLVLVLIYMLENFSSDSFMEYKRGTWPWWTRKLKQWSAVIFAVYISLWTKWYQIEWEGHETEFAIKYGQFEVEKTKTERPKFKGILTRNLLDDRMNDGGKDPKKKNWAVIVTTIFLIIVCIGTAVSCFFILKAKRQAYLDDIFGQGKEVDFNFVMLLFDTIEFFRIMIFQSLFYRIISLLVKWQNLKYSEDHESQLILNLGLYQIFNNSCVIALISVQSLISNVTLRINEEGEEVVEEGSSPCISESCTYELNTFFATYCILHLIWTLAFKLIVLPLLEKLEGYAKKTLTKTIQGITKLVSKKNPTKRMSTTASGNNLDFMTNEELKNAVSNYVKALLGDEDRQKKQIEKIVKLHYLNPSFLYEEINKEIDHQVTMLSEYKTGDDYDQGLFDYLELFNSYAYTTMFGVLFPISYLTSLIIAFAEWKMDRANLLHHSRRPSPRSCKTIGLWLDMIRLVSLFAVVTNSWYIAFILFERKEYEVKFGTFIAMSIGLFLLNYFMYEKFSGMSSVSSTILERTSFIKDKLFARTKPKILSKAKQAFEISSTVFGAGKNSKKEQDYLKIALEMNEEFEAEQRQKYETGVMKDLALNRLVNISKYEPVPVNISNVNTKNNSPTKQPFESPPHRDYVYHGNFDEIDMPPTPKAPKM